MLQRVASSLLLVALAPVGAIVGTPSADAAAPPATGMPVPSWDHEQVHSIARGGVDLDAPHDDVGDADDPGDLVWEAFTNPAYHCQAGGDFWFLVVERIEQAPPRAPSGAVLAAGPVRPLVVTLLGLNLGTFQADGTPLPPPGTYTDHPMGAVVPGADQEAIDAQSALLRAAFRPGTFEADLLADGWRVLAPGSCDTDAYAGLGTPYPNHPDPEQTVDGGLATAAAIEDVVTSGRGLPASSPPDAPLRPTSHVLLVGTSAGAIGAHAVAHTLRTTERPDAPDGIVVSGVILDSGIISDRQLEVWLSDDGLRLPPTLPTHQFLVDLGQKLQHPTLTQPGGHVDELVAAGWDVPVLAVYDLHDPACGGAAGTPGLTHPEHPEAYDGELCRYAYSGLAEATRRPAAHPRSRVLELDGEAAGFGTHGLLGEVGHPAVAAARAWVDQLVATRATPWPYLPVHRLSQVSRDPWTDRSFVDAVSWAVDRGIVDGYEGAACDGAPSPCFGPARPVSRQAAAAFLHRLAGAPAPGEATGTPFRDVGPSHPFASAITWAASEGLTTGYADGTFRPGSPITRQAAAALLHRAAGSPPPPPDAPSFPDVGPTHPFVTEVAWMAGNAITAGYEDGTFRPGTLVTRRAVVSFLHRLVNRPSAWAPDAPGAG